MVSARHNYFWLPKVVALLTSNEAGLREVYNKIFELSDAYRKVGISISDCEECLQKMGYPLDRDQMFRLFVESKADSPEEAQYERLSFGEFLEFICRVTLHMYKGSEMEPLVF